MELYHLSSHTPSWCAQVSSFLSISLSFFTSLFISFSTSIFLPQCLIFINSFCFFATLLSFLFIFLPFFYFLSLSLSNSIFLFRFPCRIFLNSSFSLCFNFFPFLVFLLCFNALFTFLLLFVSCIGYCLSLSLSFLLQASGVTYLQSREPEELKSRSVCAGDRKEQGGS